MMTRKPDDVKKGLACAGLHTCPDEKCPYYASCAPCELQVQDDALALIQQLQAENAEKDRKIQQLEATVSEKEKVVGELSGKIGQLEADNKLLQDAVDQWELVAASPGAVEDMARENTELLEKVEQLQAERDAAVADVHRSCFTCKKFGKSEYLNTMCNECIGWRNWEWRGVTKEVAE